MQRLPKLLTLHINLVIELEGGFGTQYLEFIIMGLINSMDAATHHSAIVYIALSNPKIWVFSLQLIHLLFLESLQIQSLQPFD